MRLKAFLDLWHERWKFCPFLWIKARFKLIDMFLSLRVYRQQRIVNWLEALSTIRTQILFISLLFLGCRLQLLHRNGTGWTVAPKDCLRIRLPVLDVHRASVRVAFLQSVISWHHKLMVTGLILIKAVVDWRAILLFEWRRSTEVLGRSFPRNSIVSLKGCISWTKSTKISYRTVHQVCLHAGVQLVHLWRKASLKRLLLCS